MPVVFEVSVPVKKHLTLSSAVISKALAVVEPVQPDSNTQSTLYIKTSYHCEIGLQAAPKFSPDLAEQILHD